MRPYYVFPFEGGDDVVDPFLDAVPIIQEGELRHQLSPRHPRRADLSSISAENSDGDPYIDEWF